MAAAAETSTVQFDYASKIAIPAFTKVFADYSQDKVGL